ncbi:ABC transporter permease [Chitinophaga niabensis]|uniref:ABC transporter permease n=1 Tax=Chitinophaga niabensis TaxID=536979 RepID=UPI0031BAEFDE
MILQTKRLFRHLWRQRLFTLLNVLGLAVSISACWVIYRIVSYEYSFDDRLPQKEQTFRLVTGLAFDGKESYNGGVSAPLYQGVREQVPGLKRVVPVFKKWIDAVSIPGQPPLEMTEFPGIVATDSSYFDMVPYTWLAGNPATALNAPENVVLTESRAKSYFGALKPETLIGRALVYNGKDQKTITGIVKDLDYPTEFTAKEFFVLPSKQYELAEWTNTNGSDLLYLQLNDRADTARVLAQISNLAKQKWDENAIDKNLPNVMKRWYMLLPLEDSHFSTFIKEWETRKASKPVMKGLIGLGALLIVLACINYINLSTALIPQRSREIGMRKILGGNSSSLIKNILAETFVVVLLAVASSFIFTKMAYSFLGDIIPDGMHEYSNGWWILYFLLALLIGVTLLSGGYPAWLITKVKPISLIQGAGTLHLNNGSRIGLRKVLIVFQFLIAQVFIAGALIMGSQLNYTLKKDMGFDKDAVVLVTVPWKLQRDSVNRDKYFVLTEELKRESGIQAVSLGREPMSANYSSSLFENKGIQAKDPVRLQLYKKWADTAYIRFYNMPLIAGRNIRPSDTTNEYIINETAVRALGFSSAQDAVGKLIGQLNQAQYPVVGVVKDFHTRDFHSSIDPVVILADKRSLNTINIKLNGADPGKWQQTLKMIEQKWNTFYPAGSFAYKFYDETLAAMYKQERNQSRLINLAMVIAVIISCLGLFGLAVLIAFQRTKEIGIRKVLGATVAGIAKMLMSDFVKLIIIALLLASPIAWWGMNRWLEDFVYRVKIEWWMFLLSGAAAVLIAMLTISFQAIRAALANPVKSLRTV